MSGWPQGFSLPVSRVIPLTEFSEAKSLFSSWQGRFEQISSGRFEGNLQIVQGRLVRAVAIQSNQQVLLRGHDAAGLISVYLVTNGNSGSLWQGVRLTSGHVVVHGCGATTDHYTARRTDNLGVSLHPEALDDAARVLLARDDVTVPQNWSTLLPPSEIFSRLNRQLSRLVSQGIADPSLLGTPEGDGFEQECVRSLVASLFAASPSQPKLSLSSRSRLLRQADEFMRSHLGDPVGAIVLCRELKVSDRTLRLAFREQFGVGPMVYFKCLRLNAVRSQLQKSSPQGISETARMFGFNHLGNFAADYRRLFGERPSDTARGSSDPAFLPPWEIRRVE